MEGLLRSGSTPGSKHNRNRLETVEVRAGRASTSDARECNHIERESPKVPHIKVVQERIPVAELDHFKSILQAKRQEVLNLYRHDVQVGQESTDDNADDFADRANNSYNRETMFAISDSERSLLFAIDEALRRIDKGVFGECVHCASSIGKPRIEALPWAAFCIDCQELKEKGLLD